MVSVPPWPHLNKTKMSCVREWVKGERRRGEEDGGVMDVASECRLCQRAGRSMRMP